MEERGGATAPLPQRGEPAMLKKLPALLAALVLASALSGAAPARALEFEAAIGFGDVYYAVDNDVDYVTGVIEPRLEVSTFRETPGFGAVGQMRMAFDTWDADGWYSDYYEADVRDLRCFEVQGLVGWAFEIESGISLAPVVGLSYRDFSTRYEVQDTGEVVDYDFKLVSMDFGLRLVSHDDLFGGNLQFTMGPIISGEAELDSDLGAGADADIDGGLVLEVRGTMRWAVFTAGLSYELIIQDVGGSLDTEDQIEKFTLHFGMGFMF